MGALTPSLGSLATGLNVKNKLIDDVITLTQYAGAGGRSDADNVDAAAVAGRI